MSWHRDPRHQDRHEDRHRERHEERREERAARWAERWEQREHRPRNPVFVPAFVAVAQVFGTHVAARGQSSRHSLDALCYLLLLAGPAILLFRRSRPVAVCAGTAAVTVVYLLLRYPYGPVFLSLAVGFVSAVLAGHRRDAWLSVAAVYLAHLGVVLGTHGFAWRTETALLVWMLLVALAVEVVRSRIERRDQWRQARLERQQRIADEQRIEVARELHDVLAHSISLINIQAGVALELLDDDPEQARTALTTIKKTSKDALGEVRQVLGTLRAPGSAAPRRPAPGLDRLGELVEQASAAGLTVRQHTEGAPRPLPQGVELAAFRIVQEALTNVIRHSSAREAEVLVAYRGAELLVRVRDPGPLSATGGPRAGGSGSGLVGMRERVAALGGSVRAERRAAGFEVEAVLPTDRPGPRGSVRRSPADAPPGCPATPPEGPGTPSEPSEPSELIDPTQGDHR